MCSDTLVYKFRGVCGRQCFPLSNGSISVFFNLVQRHLYCGVLFYNTNFENRITRMSPLFLIRVTCLLSEVSARNSCIVLLSFIRDITLAYFFVIMYKSLR